MDAKDLTLEQKLNGMAAQALAACGQKEEAKWASNGNFHFESSGWAVRDAAEKGYHLGRAEALAEQRKT